jgi:regulatory protein
MPTVTALHPERRDRVRVDLDGAAWRTLPAAAVVAAGLGVGAVLDRQRARELRRALRRAEALDAAGRALARHDRSPAGLEAVLERRGVAAGERQAAVETLERLGYVDERRFAESRAAALAGRGYGDEAIRFDLEREGVGGEAASQALGSLEPEHERAVALVAGGKDDAKSARQLLARGFSPETVEGALGARED